MPEISQPMDMTEKGKEQCGWEGFGDGACRRGQTLFCRNAEGCGVPSGRFPDGVNRHPSPVVVVHARISRVHDPGCLLRHYLPRHTNSPPLVTLFADGITMQATNPMANAVKEYADDFPELAARGLGITTNAERWNGRHAMFGMFAIVFTAYMKGHGLIPDADKVYMPPPTRLPPRRIPLTPPPLPKEGRPLSLPPPVSLPPPPLPYLAALPCSCPSLFLRQ